MQAIPDKKSISLSDDPENPAIIPVNAYKYQFSHLPWLGPEVNGNQLIMDYIQMYYNNPVDYSSVIYLSQLFQAEALKSAIETHRLHKPFTMGTIFWQFNDCWPGINWSVIDYYHHRKPAFYAVRKAFKNQVIIPERLYGDVRVWAVNDSSETFDGDCTISLMDFYGKILYSKNIKIVVPSDQTQILWLINEENLLKTKLANTVFLNVVLRDKSNIVDDNFLFFSEPRFLDLPVPDITYTIEPYKTSYKIILSSNCFVKNLLLSASNLNINFSDNNLDIIPGSIYTIYTDFNGRKDELENNLKIISLIDSY
jgi:beta-mannosidase